MSLLIHHPAPPPAHPRDPRGQAGYTLIELVVSMALGIIVVLGAFSFLEFTTADVARITERVHVAQTGRTVMERLMLELHSACVSPLVTPVRASSTENVLRYISQSGTEATFSTVELHEVIYTAPTGSSTGSLTEKSWPSTGGTPPEYTFNETTTPTTQKLLTGVKQSQTEETTPKAIPVFRYYRYYREGDHEPVYGALYPTELTGTLAEGEAKRVVKVTVSFTVTPERAETSGLGRDRPLPLQDSAILRLTPASESAAIPNAPCS